jgi:DNA ligase-associated metallophosphoesterase
MKETLHGGACALEWVGFHWQMLPEKALYWEEQKALLIADAHLGKVTHFRKAGMGVPPATTQHNWDRLESLMAYWQPQEVIFLGDLFHSEMNSEWLLLKEFMAAHDPVKFHLVLGNHDIIPEAAYRHGGLICHPEPYFRQGIALAHHPPEAGETPTLYGHLHPGVLLHGMGKQRMRLPCFYWEEKEAVLPAFGAFTGLHTLPVKTRSSVFAVAEHQLMAVHRGLAAKPT